MILFLYFPQIIPHCITLCITVFGALGSWGGSGLELRVPVKIKTARPAQMARQTQKSKKQRNPTKKTHRLVRF
jgi:hypothetical protein